MRGYPIKDWKTDGAFYSTYALAHILGWDFITYLKFTNAICFRLAKSINGYSAAALSISKHRRIIGGWLFVDVPTMNFFLDRFGWPSVEDIFSCLDEGISPLDYLANTGAENRIIIEDFRGKHVIFPEITQNIFEYTRFSCKMFNNLSRKRRKIHKVSMISKRVSFRQKRLEISAKHVALSRIQVEIPARTVAGVKGLPIR